ncbi:MAG: tocopherol cyclase family protein [Chitinophagales bacterium]
MKKEYPLSISSFADSSFQINIGENILNDSLLRGTISSGVNEVKWNLEYRGDEPPLAVLPEQWYKGGFPKAKLVVSLPLAVFNGTINVNGTRLDIQDWCGSQNHNWGPRHTDHYAWGQVAGFDSHPESFFEVATARMKMGQFWTPFLTLMVLRHNGREYRLNTPWPSLLAKAAFGYFHWHFSSKANGVQIEGTIRAGKEAFSCLNYYNPPGGSKFCLNTKIASCSLKLTYADGTTEVLDTNHRAAFEILTDDASHGLTIAT